MLYIGMKNAYIKTTKNFMNKIFVLTEVNEGIWDEVGELTCASPPYVYDLCRKK